MKDRSHAARGAGEAASRQSLEETVSNPQASQEELLAAAADPALNEDLALLLLRRRDLNGEVLEALKRNRRAYKSRKVRLALLTHQKTPRHVSLPEIRQLFTFELMQVALLPHTPADIKMAADDVLIARVESISAGERLSLAKQGSGAVASAMLLDMEHRIVHAAMDNPRLTETLVVRAVLRQCAMQDPAPELAPAACRHKVWSQRTEVRAALLRHSFTPLAHAIVFAQALGPELVRELMKQSRLPENVREYLQEMADRAAAKRR